MNFTRILRHLLLPPRWLQRRFPAATRAAIAHAIAHSERGHSGELRFAIEATLPVTALLRGQSARERALQVFSDLRVWDTAANSGVLIYLQLADRRVEIVADRGINARVAQSEWDAVCRRMEAAYRRGEFEAGSIAAIEEITALLQQHFPVAHADHNPDELCNQPVVLD
jgi:uncharacterized membrane protein